MSHLLLVALVLVTCTGLITCADTVPGASTEAPNPYLHADRGTTCADLEIALLVQAGQGPLGFVDQFDLGTALFLQGKYPEAALAYRLAVGMAATDPDRVAALLATSQALALGNATHEPATYRRAAALANAAQRLEPMNAKIAYFRVARWNEANDQLEVQTARAMLERFTLAENGKAVLEPMTTCVIVIGIAGAAAITTYFAAERGSITHEQRQIVLQGILITAVGSILVAAPGLAPVILAPTRMLMAHL